MAKKITFGVDVPEVSTTSVDSGAIGTTANTSTQTKVDTGPNMSVASESDLTPSFGPMTRMPTEDVPVAVDTEQLESPTGFALPESSEPSRIEVSVPTTEELTNAELEGIKGAAGEIQSTLDKNKERFDLEAERDEMKDDIEEGFDSLSTLGDFESRVAEKVQLQRKRELKTAIDNKIMKKSRDFDLALRRAEDSFGTRAQKNAIKAEITKNYNRELADLSIIQMARAGEFNDAKAYVDQKVQLEMQDRKANLDKLMFFYAENKERLSLVDQRAFQSKITQDERAYQEDLAKRTNLENFRFGLIQAAISAGAGNGTLSALQNADTMEDILATDLSIFGPQLTGGGGFKAPTVKKINGVDMQWDEVNGQWVELPGAGASDYSTAKVEQTRGVIGTLLSKAVASPGIFGRSAAVPIPMFARSDAFRDYAGQLDTLKANIAFNELSAMREASKTGGALGQVSERELSLLENSLGGLKMTQTPAQVQSELRKIDASLARWQEAVQQFGGGTPTGTLVTAPNGQVVEIID